MKKEKYILEVDCLMADSLPCIIIIVFVFASLCSCSSSKQVTQLVEHTSVDTVYLNKLQYDSIYIYQDRLIDRSRDTITITKTNNEFRYKLLRDTIYKVQHDSIPYTVTVTQYEERPFSFWDSICRICFYLALGLFFVKGLSLFSYFKSNKS